MICLDYCDISRIRVVIIMSNNWFCIMVLGYSMIVISTFRSIFDLRRFRERIVIWGGYVVWYIEM